MSSSFLHPIAATAPLVTPSAAVVLPGGRVALVIEHAQTALPSNGTVEGAGDWTALTWETAGGRAGLALLQSMPQHGARLTDGEGAVVAHIARPDHLDVTAAPLVRLIRDAGGTAGEVLAFLRTHSAAVSSALVADFLAKAAEHTGFVELVVRTECGGLFLQGWSQSFEAGAAGILGFSGRDGDDIEMARFEREDILPPASGFCLYARLVDTDAPIPPAFYIHRTGRLERVDVVPAISPALRGPAATAHVRAMLDRLQAPKTTIAAFRRICRPRYEGQDTLSDYGGPVAAALDRVLQAADGTLLVSGWLLDPLSRVEHVLLKNSSDLYAPLHATWNLLPRPDLNHGFANTPRFAGLLDEREVMHGFICHTPASPERSAGELYLELVLDDGTCLFRPVDVMPCQGDGVLPAVLSGLFSDELELPAIIETHLVPFFAGLARRVGSLRKIGRPVALGPGKAGRDVCAIVPISGLAELQPLFGALAGLSDADGMDITLVAGRSVAAEHRGALNDSFHFYGLTGDLVVVPDHANVAARLDAGVDAGMSPRVLVWHTCALPRGSGWLARLTAEADRLESGLVSPVLLYEDGSIYFDGTRLELGTRGAACLRAGFGGHALGSDGARQVSAGAAEIALLDRALLGAAGGFSGHLIGDAYTHLDLARRLRQAGGQAWCATSIAFWMVEDPRPEDQTPLIRMTRAVDAALIARRNQEGVRP